MPDPHLEKACLLEQGQDKFYQQQLKSGIFPHHHQFTIIIEVKHGHANIPNAAEGAYDPLLLSSYQSYLTASNKAIGLQQDVFLMMQMELCMADKP